ncbi:DUF262 domain-containing protein [bacterium]|nr:DUF262 domain-containing protein [bacterium]
MSEINGAKIALHKLFDNEFFFIIPEYQRPYSWQKEHCQQLFDDIYDSSGICVPIQKSDTHG